MCPWNHTATPLPAALTAPAIGACGGSWLDAFPSVVTVHAAAAHWTVPELEELARRHTSATASTFDLSDLQSRLEATEWLDDREFARHGLDAEAILRLRRCAQSWADDIAERLLEEEALASPPEEDTE